MENRAFFPAGTPNDQDAQQLRAHLMATQKSASVTPVPGSGPGPQRTSPGFSAALSAKLTSPSRSSSAGSSAGSSAVPKYPSDSALQHPSPSGHAASQAQAANTRWFGSHGEADYNRLLQQQQQQQQLYHQHLRQQQQQRALQVPTVATTSAARDPYGQVAALGSRGGMGQQPPPPHPAKYAAEQWRQQQEQNQQLQMFQQQQKMVQMAAAAAALTASAEKSAALRSSAAASATPAAVGSFDSAGEASASLQRTPEGLVQCKACTREANFMCSACRGAHYCSLECQVGLHENPFLQAETAAANILLGLRQTPCQGQGFHLKSA